MNGSLQVLVALDDEIERGMVDTLVAGKANATVLDYLEVGGSTASGYGSGDVLIVACIDYTPEVATYVKEAARQHPSRPIVLLAPRGHNGYLREVFSSGVDDMVDLPTEQNGEIDPELVKHLTFTLEKAVVRKQDTDLDKPLGEGRIICVLGLKGGSGKTLTTVNLGASLAQKGHSVAIIDLDLQFGDLALAMGLSPERTMYDLVHSGGSLDADKLRDFMIEHPSGARALLSPLRPDHAAFIQVPFLREVLRLLRETHEYVIVDTPPNFTPEVIAAVDMSTDVLVVPMLDTLSLKNTKLGLETLYRMGYDRSAIRILLNRANTKVGIDHRDVLAILGRDVDVFVPSSRDVTRSINQGTPISLQSGGTAGKAFRELAELYRDPRPVDAKAGKRSRDAVESESAATPPEAGDSSATVPSPRRRLLRWRRA
jgi:pilus assembly protein CpaE